MTAMSSDASDRLLLSIVAASFVNRKASLRAYQKKKLSLTTPDIITELADIVAELTPEIAPV